MRHAVPITLSALAWVLWLESSPLQGADTGKATWSIVESYPQEARCRSIALELTRRESLNLAYRMQYRCFPDTVDPRPR